MEANSHPIKVTKVADEGFYANSHPYKVAIVGGGGGQEGRVVGELPETGETGYIYLVLKEESEEGDIYDEYMWVLQNDGETYGWEHIGATNEVTITLYDNVGTNTDGAMTQKATTDMIFVNGQTDTVNIGTSTATKQPTSVLIGYHRRLASIDTGAVVIGHENESSIYNIGYRAIAIGENARGTSTASIAIGDDNQATGIHSLAFGGRTRSTNNNTIAVGDGASSTGSNGIAIGSQTIANKVGTIAIGYAANSTSLGSGERNVFVGVQTGLPNNNSTSAESVALGSYSVIGRSYEVSVGSGAATNGTRFVANVTAGELDTDAVNLGQMISYQTINGSGAPTTATEGKYVGQLYLDTDADDMYYLAEIDDTTDPVAYTWNTIGQTGGGGAIELTTADYDYPTGDPTSIASWKLPEGEYYISGGPVYVRLRSTSGINVAHGRFIIQDTNNSAYKSILGIYSAANSVNTTQMVGGMVADDAGRRYWVTTIGSTVANGDEPQRLLTKSDIFFNGKVTNIQIGGVANPQFNDAGGIAIGQSASATGYQATALGMSASASNTWALAAGWGARAIHQHSVALGNGSVTGRASEVAVGEGSDNSNYGTRYIANVRDPELAQDAATKNYVDTQVGNIDTALQTLLNGTGA